MTAIDTNVLVRYITRDEPGQYRAAKAFLVSHCMRETSGFVNTIVQCKRNGWLAAAGDVIVESNTVGVPNALD